MTTRPGVWVCVGGGGADGGGGGVGVGVAWKIEMIYLVQWCW